MVTDIESKWYSMKVEYCEVNREIWATKVCVIAR